MKKASDPEEFDPDLLPPDILNAIEADTFWCLTRLLDGIQDNYIFAQPGIQRSVKRMADLVARIDGRVSIALMNNCEPLLSCSPARCTFTTGECRVYAIRVSMDELPPYAGNERKEYDTHVGHILCGLVNYMLCWLLTLAFAFDRRKVQKHFLSSIFTSVLHSSCNGARSYKKWTFRCSY